MTDAEILRGIANWLPDFWDSSRDDLLRIAQRLEELDRKVDDSHVCALNQSMDGTCFRCGSKLEDRDGILGQK